MTAITLLIPLVTATATSTYTPPRTSQAPVIDGDISDAAWQGAPVLDDFTQKYPEEDEDPSEDTEVRVLYDDRALYFAFRCRASPEDIVSRLTRRDRDVHGDEVAIDLDTRGDGRSAYHFEVTASGVQRDAIRTGDESLSYEWDAVWRSATRIDAEGWTAEIAIPFTALRFEGAQVTRFRMQLRRFIATRNETDEWVLVPREEHGEMLRYGTLEGLDGVPAPHGFALAPFGLARARDRWAPPDLGLPRGQDLSWSVGLDAQYGLTSSLILDATVLPDFGQVEADQVVLNLSTFEVHYPEKRPFFLEGADLFLLPDVWGDPQGAQPFYSRRLGPPAPEPVLPEGATIRDTPERVRIYGAAKVTGRIGASTSIALLDGVSAAEEATLRLASGSTLIEGLAPRSNYFAGRLRTELGDTTAGLMVTSVNRSEHGLGIAASCPGGLSPGFDGRCTRDAAVMAVDLAWHSPGGGWLGNATLLGSQLAGGPTQVLPDGTVLRPDDSDVGARVEAAKASGNLGGELLWEAYGPRLELNETGYLQSQNLNRIFTQLSWREFERGPTKETKVALELFDRHAFDGARLAQGIQLNNSTTWRGDWHSWVELQRYPTTWDNRETRDGALTERVDQYGLELALTSPATGSFFGSLSSVLRNTWKGHHLTLEGDFGFHPLGRLQLDLVATLEDLSGDPRFIETRGAAVGRAYRFGLQAARATSVTLRSTFTFTPALSVLGYAQLFFSSVRWSELYDLPRDEGRPTLALADLAPVPGVDPHAYDATDAVLDVNAVLRWEYLPGSALYLVYTRAHLGGLAAPRLDGRGRPLSAPAYDLASLGRGPIEDAVLLKVSYLFAG
jgi:hypothetical protein